MSCKFPLLMCAWSHFSLALTSPSPAFREPHTRLELPCALPLCASMCFFEQNLSRPWSPLFARDLQVDLSRRCSRTRSLGLLPRRVSVACVVHQGWWHLRRPRTTLCTHSVSPRVLSTHAVPPRGGFCKLFRGTLAGLSPEPPRAPQP